MEFVKKHMLSFIGVAVGLIGGYLYYHFVGCNSGSCSITSSPFNMTLYGGFMGWVVFDLFKSKQSNKQSKTQSDE